MKRAKAPIPYFREGICTNSKDSGIAHTTCANTEQDSTVKMWICANKLKLHTEFGFLHLRKWVTIVRYCNQYENVKLKRVVL